MIKRTFFEKEIFTNSKPLSFVCPTCNIGHFRVSADDISKRKTAAEIKARNNQSNAIGEYEMFRFVTLPACDSCGEIVSIAGSAAFYNELHSRAASGYMGHKYVGFTPIHFYPPINIFPISEHCPNEIEILILKAFSHFWNDLGASANRVRAALELIMEQQGMAGNTLHAKIVSFKNVNINLAERLVAVKWIGNIGSHENGITKDELLDGFELLYSVIDELYDKPNKDNNLNKKAQKIIQDNNIKL